MGQLDLGHHQRRVLALEFVDFPEMLTDMQVMADLLEHRPLDHVREQRLGIIQRDGILELVAVNTVSAGLDVQMCLLTEDAHPHGTALIVAEIALAHGHAALDLRAPALVGHQKLAFDFEGHGRSLRPVWPVLSRHSRGGRSRGAPLFQGATECLVNFGRCIYSASSGSSPV